MKRIQEGLVSLVSSEMPIEIPSFQGVIKGNNREARKRYRGKARALARDRLIDHGDTRVFAVDRSTH